MANQFTTVKDGLNINVTTASPGLQNLGDVTVNSSTSNLQYYNGTTAADIDTASNTLTLTNKTINATVNTITNIANASIAAAAAIAYSKLNLAGSVQSSDFASTSGSGAVVLANSPTLVTPALGTPSALVGTNITGTASGLTAGNINATTNSTLTSLPNLSLPASQFTGILSTTNGGTGQNLSSSTGVLQITSGSVSASTVSLLSQVSGVLPIANGGTASSTSTQAFQTLAPSASVPGQNITWNGTSWTTATPAAGTKNYLTALTTSNGTNTGNGNFEFGNTTGWSLGTVGTLNNGIPTGTPTFGSGASGTLSFSAISSNPLSGSYSGSLVSSGATTAGNMLASSAFYIDNEDQAKVLTFKQYFFVQSGAANCNFSGTSSNSFGIAVYDVTNSSWLSSTSNFGMTQSSGIGYVTGTCQTNSNTTQLRYVLYCANATTGAVTLNIDDVFVGPQTAPLGAVVTDWVPYTPSFVGWGTVSGVTFYSRRVGDTLEVQGSVVTGTPTATPIQVSLGYNGSNNNVVINTAKAIGFIGKAAAGQSGTTYFSMSVLAPTSNQTYVQMGTQLSTVNELSYANGNVVGGSTIVQMFFSAPIVGWSSNVQMSSDTDTRVIAAKVNLTSNQSLSSGAQQQVIFNSVEKDTSGSYSTSTGNYTVPVTGFYSVTVNGSLTTSPGTVNQGFFVYKNGSLYAQVSEIQYSTSFLGNGTVSDIYCNAGDTLAIYAFQNSGGTLSINGSSTSTFASFQRTSGPSVIAATESVNMSYSGTSGITVTTGSSGTITFTTKNRDSHNQYNGGIYTIPVSGFYTFQANIATASTNATGICVQIQRNGSNIAQGSYVTASASYSIASAYIGYPCNAGDTIKFNLYNANSGSITTDTSITTSYCSIIRVGN